MQKILRCLTFVLAISVAGPMAAWAQDNDRHRYLATEFSGRVLDPFTQEPIQGAVVSASWVLVSSAGTTIADGSPRLYTEQVQTDADGRFRIAGWKGGLSAPSGWMLASGLDPMIRVYKNGYEHRELRGISPAAMVASRGSGRPRSTGGADLDPERIYLRRLGSGPGRRAEPRSADQLDEWQIWRQHFEEELAASKWTARSGRSAKNQRLLYELIASNCREVAPEVRDQICVSEKSDEAKLMKAVITPARHVAPEFPGVPNSATESPPNPRSGKLEGRAPYADKTNIGSKPSAADQGQ